MFVDEKRLGEQQVDTRSDLERFIAWAMTRDPNETYLFTLPRSCLIARWDQSEGRTWPRTARAVAQLFGGRGLDIAFYDGFNHISKERTVGKALAVALRIQGEK